MNPAEFTHLAAAEEQMWWFRGMRSIFDQVFAPPLRAGRVRRVLEAGCGTGYNSRHLQDAYGWELTPLDYSELGLRYARGMGLSRLVAGDIRALPFLSGQFDAVVSLDVIVHLPAGEETSAFQEFARVLRPGGLLALRCSALDILRSRHSLHAQERQRLTAPRLRAAAANAALRVERLTYANSLLLPVALFKFRIWEPLFAPEPRSGVETPAPWLNSLLELPLRLESFWLGRGLGFPAGQSLLLLARKPS